MKGSAVRIRASASSREAYFEASAAALALEDESTIELLIDFVAGLPPAARSPLLRAGAGRLDGLLALRRGDAERADELLALAARELSSVGARFFLAQILLERATTVLAADRPSDAETLLSEARSVFERLRATPWLDRLEAIAASRAAA